MFTEGVTRPIQCGGYIVHFKLCPIGSGHLSSRSKESQGDGGHNKVEGTYRQIPARTCQAEVVTYLLIIRHGQSEWNLTGRWQGQADPPLTKLGERQAEIAGHALAERPQDGQQAGFQNARQGRSVQRVVTSDLERARHTAEILAEILGVVDLVVDQTLRERHAGEWEGLTRAEIEKQWPGAIAARRWPPHFESEQSLAKRLLPTLRELCAGLEPDAGVLMVSHAGVVKTVDLYVGAEEGPVPNLAGRWYKIKASGDCAGSGGGVSDTSAWGWEHLEPGEQVHFVPSDIDLAIE